MAPDCPVTYAQGLCVDITAVLLPSTFYRITHHGQGLSKSGLRERIVISVNVPENESKDVPRATLATQLAIGGQSFE